MADIETLLGMGLESGDDLKALARQLRGQQQLGSALSLSTIPQVSALGAAERGSAESAAKRGGALRQTMATRARQASRDAEADRDDVRDYDYQLGRDKIEDRYKRDKLVSTAGNVGSLHKWSSPFDIEGVNVSTRTAPKTGGLEMQIVGSPEVFASEEFQTRKEAFLRSREKTKQAEKQGTNLADTEQSVRENMSKLRASSTRLRNAQQALRGNAQSGPIASFFPTFSPETLEFERQMSADALATAPSLSKITDKEGDWIKEAQYNKRQPEEQIYQILEHKIAAQERVAKADEYISSQMAKREPVDDAVVKGILHEGGFKFEDPPFQKNFRIPERDYGSAFGPEEPPADNPPPGVPQAQYDSYPAAVQREIWNQMGSAQR